MTSILQPAAINISTWRDDELYFNYPEGARSKNALFPPEDIDLKFINPTRRYLYKRSVKRYPDQFWGEVVAYQVGGLLGVQVPPAYAAYDSRQNDCGALIEWFYEDGKASFVPGGNYMQQMMPDYDRKRGLQHNFHSIQILSKAFTQAKLAQQDWEQYWAEALLFDALIGNTDRHQDNWGYLFVKTKEKVSAHLSPLFDNGTSLGHERFTAAVATWTDADYERYVSKGTHHMKWLKDDPKSEGHFEMVSKIAKQWERLKPVLLQMLNDFSLPALEVCLEQLSKLELPVPLSDARRAMYVRLIALRRTKLISVLS